MLGFIALAARAMMLFGEMRDPADRNLITRR